jgi:hypothetical protein
LAQDRLNALVLAGEKVATAGPWEQDYVNEDEALEAVGERLSCRYKVGTSFTRWR